MKDHEIARLVNHVTNAVKRICPNAPQMLRQVISRAVNRKIRKPIARKEFDIDKYEFSDIGIDRAAIEHGNVISLYNFEMRTSINKQDAIAMAKHFKLTADDL